MARKRDRCNAWRELHPVHICADPTGPVCDLDAGDVLTFRVLPELPAVCERSGPESSFALGHVQGCAWEGVEVADVIPVEVGDDDLGDRGPVDPQTCERLDR